MWTQVTRLLEIKIEDDDDSLAKWDEHLLTLNDWLIREYGGGLSCEEIELAYNALVKEELRKDDGRLMEAYPILDARHLGEVLAAYRRQIAGDSTVQKVIAGQLYLPQPSEPTTEQIDDFMEKALSIAIEQVRDGVFYVDDGNGLYRWLHEKGRIFPAEDEWNAALNKAQPAVKLDLIEQKRQAGLFERRRAKESHTDHITPLRQRIGNQLADATRGDGDFIRRVRSEAFRIILRTYLRYQVLDWFGFLPDEAARPTTEDDSIKPFSHAAWIQNLKEQLPTMGDEQVSDLQRKARNQNVLDVYELATAEWNKRVVKPKQKSK